MSQTPASTGRHQACGMTTSTGTGFERRYLVALGSVREGRQSRPWRPERYRPWQGRAARVDWILMGAFTGVVMCGFATRSIKPFLLASHPVALELLTGDLLAIGAAAAFARVGEAPLWLVVLAGAIGMVKFDWLAWWAGRRWGAGMIRMVGASPQRALRHAERAARLKPWILRVAVAAAFLPGVPAPIVFAVAGIAGMPLLAFLLLDLAGAFAMTALVAGLGYGLGQHAVDVVLLIDRYATWVSLTVIGATFLIPWVRGRLRRRRHSGPGAEVMYQSEAPGTPRRQPW